MSVFPVIEQHRLSVRRVLSVMGNGAAIFSGVTDSGRSLRVVAAPKALARVPAPGEAWCIAGEMRVSPQYGAQLHATTGRYELPRGRLITRYLADHADFAGIGEAKAQRLWEAFGERLVPTLSAGDVDALEAVLTRSAAARLVEVWADKRAEAETVEFLDANGFEWRLSTTLRCVWGDRAVGMLQRNPYHLLAFASWSNVDCAALKLGVAPDDDRRLIGAVEAVLYERLLHAHTLTDRDTLLDRVARRLNRADARRAIELAVAEGAACGNAEVGYQATGAAALETGIAQRIHAMLAGEAPAQNALFPVVVDGNWAQPHIARVEAAQGFPLNEEQRTAVVMPFEHSFSVLTGGAGVGKTTVLRAVIQLAQHQNLTVLQMAIAGSAAQRMAEATGHPAMTIAKFLSATRSGQLEVPSASLVVVDEASMLDLPTLYRILKHLPDGVRMMLVGDPAQLPPIGFGLAFHRLVGNPCVPQAHLMTVHRQAASSGIPAVASSVRQHRVPVVVPFEGRHHGVSFIECCADDTMPRLRHLAQVWHGDDWQALSAVKGGRAGIHVINESFHHDMCGGEVDGALVVGEPVIHLVNDYERGLMNGALGRVVAVSDSGGLELEFDGERHSFAGAELLDRIDLAYAISVHKAQGSQFKRVAVVVGKSRLLDHALIYTALTRGVEQVVFVGDRHAFEQAVLSPPLAQRRCVAFTV
jgi:exodeoxyribonuclease V alpha subunit